MIIINAPKIFTTIWNIIKAWLDPQTTSKIQVWPLPSFIPPLLRLACTPSSSLVTPPAQSSLSCFLGLPCGSFGGSISLAVWPWDLCLRTLSSYSNRSPVTQIFSGDYEQALRDAIPEENLPVAYGGKSTVPIGAALLPLSVHALAPHTASGCWPQCLWFEVSG